MGDEPSLGEYEKFLLASGTTARKEMVLLHPERYVAPGSTRRWLKVRQAIHASRVRSRLTKLLDRNGRSSPAITISNYQES